MNMQRPRFAVDSMLGNLAKKFRILGYDTKYFSSIEDEKLIELARNENRILLTKDELLTKNAQKSGITNILVKGSDEIEQIIQIATVVGLGSFAIDTNFSRCVECNGKLQLIDKSNIANKVPRGVFDKQDKFWTCDACKKIYWEGTHFQKLQEFVSRLNERMK